MSIIQNAISAFEDTYEDYYDDPFCGDIETVETALRFADNSFDEEALMEAFANAGVAGHEDWSDEFWSELAQALENI